MFEGNIYKFKEVLIAYTCLWIVHRGIW